MQTAIALKDGTQTSVATFGTFRHIIGGESFTLAVTDDIANPGLFKNVTHVASGMRVCQLPVTAQDTAPGMVRRSDVDRARDAVDMLIKRFGADRVRAVIAKAEAEGAANA